MKVYDIAIVGGGIGGLISAYNLLSKEITLSLAIIEKGKEIENRRCPAGEQCCSSPYCYILAGIGGAGGFSDGKITWSPTIGIHYESAPYFSQNLDKYFQRLYSIFKAYSPYGKIYGNKNKIIKASDKTVIKSYPGLHIGTDGIRLFVKKMYDYIISKGANIYVGWEVIDIKIDRQREFYILHLKNSKNDHNFIKSKHLILSTGLEGAVFIEKIANKFNIPLMNRVADIGIRLESHASVFKKFMDEYYDFKIYFLSSNGLNLRTFCVNHQGFVLTENHKQLGISGVNGNSYFNKKSSMTNFAILAEIALKKISDPIIYVRTTAKKLNIQGYPILQPLYDFLDVKPPLSLQTLTPTNKKVRQGNIRKLLPVELYTAFKEFITELINAFPSLKQYGGFIYAPELKYFQYKIPINEFCCNQQTGIYFIGNASGYTANIVGASIMGLIATDNILKKEGYI